MVSHGIPKHSHFTMKYVGCITIGEVLWGTVSAVFEIAARFAGKISGAV